MESLTHGQVLARFGHALSDPTRSRLLLALREAPGYPAQLADLLRVSRQNLLDQRCHGGCHQALYGAVRGRAKPSTSDVI